MATIICPECMHEVSVKADKCPNCGFNMKNAHGPNNNNYKPKKKKGPSVWSVLGTILIILVILCVGAFAAWKYGLLTNIIGDEEQENDAWLRIERFQNEGQPDSLEAALQDYTFYYPQGRHVDMANQLIGRLETERNDWQTAISTKTIASVNAYLDSHPEGFFRVSANALLDSLSYVNALKIDTEDALDDYIRSFPEGRYVKAAQRRLKDVERISLTADEEARAQDVIKRHFMAMAENDKVELDATVSASLASYIGKKGATIEDVHLYLDHMHSSHRNIKLTPLKFSYDKVTAGQNTVYSVKFILQEVVSQKGQKAEYRYFNGVIVLDSEMLLQSLVLIKNQELTDEAAQKHADDEPEPADDEPIAQP